MPWGHNISVIKKIKDPEVKLFYIESVMTKKWTRKILLEDIYINSHLSLRKANNNFDSTLRTTSLIEIQDILKKQYNFYFIGLSETVAEKTQKKLIDNISQLLRELGLRFTSLSWRSLLY